MNSINAEQLARLIFKYCDETTEPASLPGFAAWILDNDTAYQRRGITGVITEAYLEEQYDKAAKAGDAEISHPTINVNTQMEVANG